MKTTPFLSSRTGTAPVETGTVDPIVDSSGDEFPLGIW